MGVKPQSVTNKFARDSWSVQDFVSVMDFLDCQVVIEPKPDMKILISLDDVKNVIKLMFYLHVIKFFLCGSRKLTYPPDVPPRPRPLVGYFRAECLKHG